jgi:hypothetical protein
VPIGAMFQGEGFTQAEYDRVAARVGDEPPEGCLVHIAGPTESGWQVIEVWVSEDDQRRFQADRLNPAFEAEGTSRVEPAFFPVHVVLPPPEALASLAAGG